jgi:hypothetical protein
LLGYYDADGALIYAGRVAASNSTFASMGKSLKSFLRSFRHGMPI